MVGSDVEVRFVEASRNAGRDFGINWGVRSTVIVFGSARAPSPEQAEILRRSTR